MLRVSERVEQEPCAAMAVAGDLAPYHLSLHDVYSRLLVFRVRESCPVRRGLGSGVESDR